MVFHTCLFPVNVEKQPRRITLAATRSTATSTGKVYNVPRSGELLGNLLGGIDPPYLNDGVAGLLHGVGDDLSSLGLTLRPGNDGLSLLLGPLHDPLLSLGLLGGNLLRFDRLHELPPERQVRNGHIVQGQVEVLPALDHFFLDLRRDFGTLTQELLGVVLGNDRLEHLVADGGEDTLVEVGSELPVQAGELLNYGAPEHTKLDVDHLQILGTGDRGDLPRSGPHVHNDRALDDRDNEVRSLVDHIWENTATECVEHDGALTSVNVEQTRIDGEGTDSESAGASRKASQYFIHCFLSMQQHLVSVQDWGGRWSGRWSQKIYAAAAALLRWCVVAKWRMERGEWRMAHNLSRVGDLLCYHFFCSRSIETMLAATRLGSQAFRHVSPVFPKAAASGVGSPANIMFNGRRQYSVLSKEEEEKEKARVASLSDYEKEVELRELDAKISKLNTLRGINTGELYTLRGKFKFLAKEYGMGFMVWYWTVWCSTAVLTYGAIEVLDVDAIALLSRVDNFTGFDIANKVDPTLGTIGLTVAVNELIEPLRLPIVVFTTKPVVDTLTRRY